MIFFIRNVKKWGHQLRFEDMIFESTSLFRENGPCNTRYDLSGGTKIYYKLITGDFQTSIAEVYLSGDIKQIY